MRIVPFAAFLVIICQGAAAQTSGCSAISNASDRLSCYDKAASIAGNGLEKDKTASSGSSETPSKKRSVVEMLADENAKLNAKLKTICRGC
ncbi:hypothetical protein [Bradyrhizobium sp. Ce-3]|uniref:hypothetical protein n=1 Tax=Bradyrhizobium sp. Ce-3 TaxID=2913970 RepID=UPI001FB8EBC4|nr:hypothetical protein [Bradyrhizobium sp. Ce-3]GKQ50987.1 hypothetical protein BRSPCE3_18420 [Bradyrhizobium sp. Ce-3]